MATNQLNVKIEVFKNLKYHLKLLGILKIDVPGRFRKIPINLVQRLCVLTSTSLTCISAFCFLLFNAKQSHEAAEPIAITISSFCLHCIYSIALWKCSKIEYLFETIDKTIQERMFSQ